MRRAGIAAALIVLVLGIALWLRTGDESPAPAPAVPERGTDSLAAAAPTPTSPPVSDETEPEPGTIDVPAEDPLPLDALGRPARAPEIIASRLRDSGWGCRYVTRTRLAAHEGTRVAHLIECDAGALNFLVTARPGEESVVSSLGAALAPDRNCLGDLSPEERACCSATQNAEQARSVEASDPVAVDAACMVMRDATRRCDEEPPSVTEAAARLGCAP
jgi:hypothetical protein